MAVRRSYAQAVAAVAKAAPEAGRARLVADTVALYTQPGAPFWALCALCRLWGSMGLQAHTLLDPCQPSRASCDLLAPVHRHELPGMKGERLPL